MKCPYNEFKDCYEKECHFFYRSWVIIDYETGKRGFVPRCSRADKEKKK